jgi:hypothetical protein|tara:strand:+ start:3937 stop:4446 length:510 start_codon:yes stop_codon:yes gene_type:complete
MPNYVDNEKLYNALVEYKKLCRVAENYGDEIPSIPEYIAGCFLMIGEGLSSKPNFMNYTYRDDMVMDGVENCIRYCTNFDPEKSKNPFAYFTQITYYAFLRIIQKEKKQFYIKHLVTENSGILENLEGEDVIVEVIGNKDVESIQRELKRRAKKRLKGKSLGSLEEFME